MSYSNAQTPHHARRAHTARRLSGGVAVTAALSILTAGAASAHVRVTPDAAKAGSYATLTFKVPTESDTASTTKLEVDLPSDHPFSYAAYQPVPGWSAKVTTTKLAKPVKTEDGSITEAPTKITWTANKDAAIKPGEFQTFPVSLGPVPNVGQVSFAAHQTYSDGTVVHWNEAQKGSAAPEHPAPVLYVNDTAPDADAGHGGHGASVQNWTQGASEGANDSSDDAARWLGAGGIVVGLLGLVAAVWAATRRQRS